MRYCISSKSGGAPSGVGSVKYRHHIPPAVLEPLEQLLQHRRRQLLALIGGVFVVLRWGLRRLGRPLLYYYCFTDTLLMLGEEIRARRVFPA